ncbi:hypothetical protein SDC9_154736 [bioreactor metagenome]|uniref:Uncharacterized protein n=1 Tax=bioreactor metagenome TaxID=1076179 RepID=A0A645F1B6_9ZZZZ
MKVKSYMITVYAVLVKNDKRKLEELPEAYIVPVAEYLAAQDESTSQPTA